MDLLKSRAENQKFLRGVREKIYDMEERSEKNKSKKIINMDSTKTAADIIAELQAVDTTALDVVVAAVNQAVTDLQALPASPVAPTAASVVITFTDGSTQTVPPASA